MENKKEGEKIIIALGNSITWGYLGGEYNINFSYPSQRQQAC